jgi:hypothetical protein
MPWVSELVRVTAFFPTRTSGSPQVPTWRDVAGQEPEQIMNRAGLHAEVGPFARGRLQISSQLPLRADLLYSPPADTVTEEPVMPNVGTPREAVDAMTAPARRFVAALGQIARLAVGLHASQLMEERAAVQAELSRLLRHHLDFDNNVRDFILQTNRPRQSEAVPGLLINRLGKWSEGQHTLSVMDSEGRMATATLPRFGLHVETDVNTDVERDELPVNVPATLLDELFRFSLEIVERGEPR